jgi:hypothetical protein
VSFISLSYVSLSEAPGYGGVLLEELALHCHFHSSNDNQKKKSFPFVKVNGNGEVFRCNALGYFLRSV